MEHERSWYGRIHAAITELSKSHAHDAGGYPRSAQAARSESVLQLVGPVDDGPQFASVRTTPNHYEPAVGRDVIVGDAYACTEVVVVNKKSRGPAEHGFGA